ncbi:bifunctional methionine sulfoxide reductase B/A protein [Legionella jordanis]|uniref:Peptide methionine sulfoxide reductase MsrA n=1 Tax=Legionella jordanis TaxID=456 RepID=A0A0W0VCG4_9GAMM|nr:bifunctional methionine sulfoxide reductase B/A protein [Legionella jordanis]KTD17836.1 bifunctional methionine sulfoxide reductase B/A protein [Legionella jordanis]RMX02463.1 bifunctional methionine sulfoxide reductase B/A protein [Legionella jordanis]RMX21694.1 bifunctional methionine sulfoxide reductase B/A protein [Legionella jordanis]VEH11227.1 bifunctional methionine sulfoxide reductase B/A protein [Legionella jordanis]HAT8713805.1 bifunctional methionine sulfoxide reductase B/A prote
MEPYLDKVNSLTPAAKRIICHKATEYPFTGEYNEVAETGTYLCRRCGLALFRANNQFHSGCGWPSFDDNITRAVEQRPDADGQRTEIVCGRCKAHLGHVFVGEHFTHNNLRHCVNSASIDFVPDVAVMDSEEAIVAGGCFWGIDYFLRQLPGVLKVEVGYSGGLVAEPSYEQVCQGNTGHYEVARVVFDKTKIDYRSVLKRFFEIHDPTQRTGQGPDIGHQYKSAVFYYDDEQHQEAEDLIRILRARGYNVVTRLLEVQPFWPAEGYHQSYYEKHKKAPYCHRPEARFG